MRSAHPGEGTETKETSTVMHSKIGKLAIVLIAVFTAGLMSFGTGFASFGDIDGGLAVFADKGGNGEGNDNGQDKDKDKGNQGEEGDADTENQDEVDDQDKSDNSENRKKDDAAADGESGNKGADNRGQGHDKHADDDDSTPEGDGTPTDDKNAKVGICHVTGSDSNSTNYIEVSENAVPAHEAHGDVIGISSEDECGDGTPVPDDGTATPGATPEVVT